MIPLELDLQKFNQWREESRFTYTSRLVHLSDVEIGRRLILSCDLSGKIYVHYGNEQYYYGNDIIKAAEIYNRIK